MILIVMSVEVTGFERLREEYELCPDFGEIYIASQDNSVLEMDRLLLPDEYLDIQVP